MKTLWFEEDLFAHEDAISRAANAVKGMKLPADEASQSLRDCARGIIRVDRPRWEHLSAEQVPFLTCGLAVRYYIARLGFQFDLTESGRRKGARFAFARCSACLFAARLEQPQPSVYEVIPQNLLDGEKRGVSLKLSPKISFADAEASLGAMEMDLRSGTIEPVVVGFPGHEERFPYWELRPRTGSLIGVRHFWMIIEVPNECEAVKLAVKGEADIQSVFGVIPVGPKSREWAARPSVIID